MDDVSPHEITYTSGGFQLEVDGEWDCAPMEIRFRFFIDEDEWVWKYSMMSEWVGYASVDAVEVGRAGWSIFVVPTHDGGDPDSAIQIRLVDPDESYGENGGSVWVSVRVMEEIVIGGQDWGYWVPEMLGGDPPDTGDGWTQYDRELLEEMQGDVGSLGPWVSAINTNVALLPGKLDVLQDGLDTIAGLLVADGESVASWAKMCAEGVSSVSPYTDLTGEWLAAHIVSWETWLPEMRGEESQPSFDDPVVDEAGATVGGVWEFDGALMMPDTGARQSIMDIWDVDRVPATSGPVWELTLPTGQMAALFGISADDQVVEVNWTFYANTWRTLIHTLIIALCVWAAASKVAKEFRVQ